jgi:hypothetical protein
LIVSLKELKGGYDLQPVIKALGFVERLNNVYEVGNDEVTKIVEIADLKFKVVKANCDFTVVYHPDFVHYIWEENLDSEDRKEG